MTLSSIYRSDSFLTAEGTEEETQRAQRKPSVFPPLCPLRLKNVQNVTSF